jgi:hypothetical protein
MARSVDVQEIDPLEVSCEFVEPTLSVIFW